MNIASRILINVCAVLWLVPAFADGGGSDKARSQTSGDTIKILFVGNSHLLVKNVPAQVRAKLSKKYKNVQSRMLAVGGARLSHFVGRKDVADAVSNTDWDVVVLQEASVSFLSVSGRQTFHRSVDWFLRHIKADTRVILYQTWPWRTGSGFFGSRPFDEVKMWAAMQTEYDAIARNTRLSIAPVGECWVQSARKQTLYSADGNHASEAGAKLAARIIAKTIANGHPADC